MENVHHSQTHQPNLLASCQKTSDFIFRFNRHVCDNSLTSGSNCKKVRGKWEQEFVAWRNKACAASFALFLVSGALLSLMQIRDRRAKDIK